MLRIVDRYLLRELFAAFAAVMVVLLLVTLGGVLADLLDKVARGKVPAQLLLSQIGLRSLNGLTLLLPLGLFISVLLAFGRLYRDSEIAVLSASGLRRRRMLWPLSWLVIPVAIFQAVLSFWAAPAAWRLSDSMINEANRSMLIAGLEPGRFVELQGGKTVVYVAEMEADGTHFKRLFVYREKDSRMDIVTAADGEMFRDQSGIERYLGLQKGFRVEGELGRSDFRTMRFERNDIRLPDIEKETSERAESRDSTLNLLGANSLAAYAELHWRMGAPLSTLILALMAFPLARSQPREPRYGRVLIAIFGYITYTNLLALARGWLINGDIPIELGLWWVHGAAFLLAVFLLRKGERLNGAIT